MSTSAVSVESAGDEEFDATSGTGGHSRHTHIRKQADLSIDEDDNRPSDNGRLDNLAR